MKDGDPGADLPQAALDLAAAGVPVFPCDPALKRDGTPSKAPLIDKWQARATTDPNLITSWWSRWPHALIGMPTGPRTKTTVVDVDLGKATYAYPDDLDPKELETKREAGRAAAEWWTANRPDYIHNARIVQTGTGGLHLYCWHEGERNKQGDRRNGHLGVDVRGDGGYVIVPPSPGYVVLKDAMQDAWPKAPDFTKAKPAVGGWPPRRGRGRGKGFTRDPVHVALAKDLAAAALRLAEGPPGGVQQAMLDFTSAALKAGVPPRIAEILLDGFLREGLEGERLQEHLGRIPDRVHFLERHYAKLMAEQPPPSQERAETMANLLRRKMIDSQKSDDEAQGAVAVQAIGYMSADARKALMEHLRTAGLLADPEG